MMVKVSSWRWWGSRFTEAFIALALFYLSVNLIEYREAVRKADVPAEAWFVLDEIFVPDHEIGSDPGMIYGRRVLTDHRGFWVVEAQRVNPDGREGVFQHACSGSGVDDYDTEEDPREVSWTWFFGRPCVVPPGTYRVQLTRDMTIPGYSVKQMRGWSNTFKVVPVGELPNQ